MTDEGSDDLDQQYRELLQELRVALPGVQVLLAVLLTVPFDQRFEKLGTLDTALFGLAVFAAAVAVVLLIAPTAHHRMVWRSGVKDADRLLATANRETLGGLAAMAVAIALGVYVVSQLAFSSAIAGVTGGLIAVLIAWFWFVEPMRTRAEPGSKKGTGGGA